MVETKCPLCHAPLVNGKCKKCGYISDDIVRPSVNKSPRTLAEEEKYRIYDYLQSRDESKSDKFYIYLTLLIIFSFILPLTSLCFSFVLLSKSKSKNIKLTLIPIMLGFIVNFFRLGYLFST